MKTSAEPDLQETLAKFSRASRSIKESTKLRDQAYNQLRARITLMRVRKDMPLKTLAERANIAYTSLVNYLYNGLTTMTADQIKKMVRVLS